MISRVRKRDGRFEKFSYKKLYDSIHNSIKIADKHQDSRLAKRLTDGVVKILNKNFKKKIPKVEEIKKTTGHYLLEKKLKNIRKAYLVFRYH